MRKPITMLYLSAGWFDTYASASHHFNVTGAIWVITIVKTEQPWMIWVEGTHTSSRTYNICRTIQNRVPIVQTYICLMAYSWPWFNIKMSSYQYRKPHCGDKTVVRSSYIHNGIFYSCNTTSSYWIMTLVVLRAWIDGVIPSIPPAWQHCCGSNHKRCRLICDFRFQYQ